MHAAIRPRLASGLALATAGIIAVTPVVATPQTTAAPAVAASTVLTAIDNPFPPVGGDQPAGHLQLRGTGP